MAVKALPPNIASSLETLALMVDDMWYMAGDKSTDINWYTKRALLASLYTSTGWWWARMESMGGKREELNRELRNVSGIWRRVVGRWKEGRE